MSKFKEYLERMGSVSYLPVNSDLTAMSFFHAKEILLKKFIYNTTNSYHFILEVSLDDVYTPLISLPPNEWDICAVNTDAKKHEWALCLQIYRDNGMENHIIYSPGA